MKIILASTASWAMKIFLEYRSNYIAQGRNCSYIPEYLLSYWYCYAERQRAGSKCLQLFRENHYHKLMMDSGVYTARKENVIIPVGQLADYYREFPDVISTVLGMDSGPHEEQMQKTRLMRSHGLPVVPIYHAGMPLHYLDEFCTMSNYIAIAGFEVGGNNRTGSMKFFDTIFSYLNRRNLWPVKLHLLGCEIPKILKRYPFYSADSSTGAVEAIYVWVRKWNAQTQNLENYAHPDRAINRNLTRNLFPTYQQRYAYAIEQRTLMQQFFTDWWTSKGVTWDD